MLKDWTLSGTFIWNTRFPLALTSTGSNTFLFTAVTRPNNNGHSAKLDGAVEDRLTRYFDTSAFSVPASFRLGTAGRTLPDVRSPSLWNDNLAVSRSIHFSDRIALAIRGEAYNVTNTPYFNLPGTVLGNSDFGVISSSRNERQLQVSMKLLF